MWVGNTTIADHSGDVSCLVSAGRSLRSMSENELWDTLHAPDSRKDLGWLSGCRNDSGLCRATRSPSPTLRQRPTSNRPRAVAGGSLTALAGRLVPTVIFLSLPAEGDPEKQPGEQEVPDLRDDSNAANESLGVRFLQEM